MRLTWILGLAAASRANERVQKPVNDAQIVEAANFAVRELQTLTDTGIYTTLQLTGIKSAASQVGHFHYNTYLNVELTSPYFKSKQEKEVFDVVVMKNKEDGTMSFAIDKFPVMDEHAIEMFWIEMVEKNRQRRRELFAEWEAADVVPAKDFTRQPKDEL